MGSVFEVLGAVEEGTPLMDAYTSRVERDLVKKDVMEEMEGGEGEEGEDEEDEEVEEGRDVVRVVEDWKFRRVVVVMFLVFLPPAMLVPVLPSLLLKIVGGNTSRAAFLSGVIGFSTMPVALFMQPLLGSLSDRVGRRPVLTVGLLGFALEVALLALFDTLPVYFLTRFVAVLGTVFPTTVNACVADIVVGSGQEPIYFGFVGFVAGLSFAVGPVIGGQIVGAFGETPALWISAVLSTLNCGFVYMILPETLEEKRNAAVDFSVINFLHLFRRTKLLSILVITQFFINFSNNWHSIAYLYLHETLGWTARDLGSFLTGVGLVAMISQGLFTKPALHFFGEYKALKIGFVSQFAHLLILTLATQSWQIYASLVVGGFGWIAIPTLRAIITRQVPPKEQGILQGSLAAMQTLQGGPADLLISFSFAYFTSKPHDSFWYQPRLPFGFILVNMFLATILLYQIRRVKKIDADGVI